MNTTGNNHKTPPVSLSLTIKESVPVYQNWTPVSERKGCLTIFQCSTITLKTTKAIANISISIRFRPRWNRNIAWPHVRYRWLTSTTSNLTWLLIPGGIRSTRTLIANHCNGSAPFNANTLHIPTIETEISSRTNIEWGSYTHCRTRWTSRSRLGRRDCWSWVKRMDMLHACLMGIWRVDACR
jgi:hypothetical protein